MCARLDVRTGIAMATSLPDGFVGVLPMLTRLVILLGCGVEALLLLPCLPASLPFIAVLGACGRLEYVIHNIGDEKGGYEVGGRGAGQISVLGCSHLLVGWLLQRALCEPDIAHLVSAVLDRHTNCAVSPKERSKHRVVAMSIMVAASALNIHGPFGFVRSQLKCSTVAADGDADN